jgi:lysine 6-dehydrogenase
MSPVKVSLKKGCRAMKAVICGAGMMGCAIAYDLRKSKTFNQIIVIDNNQTTLNDAQRFLKEYNILFTKRDASDHLQMKKMLRDADVAISAVPYHFNYDLTKLAVETKTHFIDLGGNNTVVKKQCKLSNQAKKQGITVIPDCGLAPGLVSIITRDIVEELDTVDTVQLRVGGLPVDPKPPLNYQIVFSPNGLINEYVEDALILDNKKILTKPSLAELETIEFPEPFGSMEAFLTSGGCSTLPYTYKQKIGYLDYKTIRYSGHCEKIKTFFDLGFADEQKQDINGCKITLREIFIAQLMKHVPTQGKDVVLLKAFGKGKKSGKSKQLEYTMIDYADEKTGLSAMMRTTGFPAAIIAEMICEGIISQRGVFCCEEVVPPKPFFELLKKRSIKLQKTIT